MGRGLRTGLHHRSINHLRDQLFPPLWVYNPYGQEPPAIGQRVKQAWHWSLMVAALVALALGFRSHARPYLLVLLGLRAVVLLYALVQPTVRYRCFFVSLTTFLAVSAGWQLVVQPLLARMRRQRTELAEEFPGA